MSKNLRFELPYPPSNNHYLGRTRSGKSFLTAVTKKFREEVVKLIDTSTTKNTFLKMTVTVYHPDKRKSDICNREKCLSDALQHAGLFEDDYLIDDIRFIRARDDKGNILLVDKGRVIITLEETTTNFNFRKIEL